MPLAATAAWQAVMFTTPAVAQLLMQEVGKHKLVVAGQVVLSHTAQPAEIMRTLRHNPPGTDASQLSAVRKFWSLHEFGLITQPCVLSHDDLKQMLLLFRQGVVVATSQLDVMGLQVYVLQASKKKKKKKLTQNKIDFFFFFYLLDKRSSEQDSKIEYCRQWKLYNQPEMSSQQSSSNRSSSCSNQKTHKSCSCQCKQWQRWCIGKPMTCPGLEYLPSSTDPIVQNDEGARNVCVHTPSSNDAFNSGTVTGRAIGDILITLASCNHRSHTHC